MWGHEHENIFEETEHKSEGIFKVTLVNILLHDPDITFIAPEYPGTVLFIPLMLSDMQYFLKMSTLFLLVLKNYF